MSDLRNLLGGDSSFLIILVIIILLCFCGDLFH